MSKKTTLLPLIVNGKISRKDIKFYTRYPWDNRTFLFSQCVSFRLKDKELMEKAFKLWFDDVIKRYGKSKWIECMVFCRPEHKKNIKK